MLHHQAAAAGHAIARRLVGEPEEPVKIPAWAGLVGLADLVIFIPILLILGYTLGAVVPTLAIVEDPNPPAYEPVALDEGSPDNGPAAPTPGKPITSSLRATRRLLSSVAGWRAYFRGFVCAAVLVFAQGTVGEIFKGFLPLIPIGALLAELALTQLNAAWTHIVISAPSKRRFYQRLPPFKKTFEATCFPILANWLANSANIIIPKLVGEALGLTFPGPPDQDGNRPQPPALDGHAAWKGFVVFLIAIAIQLLVVVPANVMLVRVQASLLPPDEETIVPFDRSFGGQVEPEIVTGKGYVNMRDALASFPYASWVRLYKLYAKILALAIASYGLMAAVIIPEMILILSKSRQS
jgi:hypothetical protein